ncbi:MAG: linear amide C-N hydrolase [Flavobacteriaceae bacterium]|nr:linear amide C-N hydrolase [Flavobacteriaceae bacterium]
MCTSIAFEKEENGPQLTARTLDFFFPLETKIAEGNSEKYSFVGMDECPGKYKFAALTYKDTQFLFDGMNEKGLSISSLWSPTAKYPNDDDIKSGKKVVQLTNVVAYILNAYDSVETLFKDLGPNGYLVISFNQDLASKKIHEFIDKSGGTLPLHFIVTDSEGKSLVIEFINGETKLYKSFSPIDTDEVSCNGVLTNYPPYNIHKDNLSLYGTLSCTNQEDGINGSGLYGMPGDVTPQSRFIRASKMKEATMFPQSADDLKEYTDYKNLNDEDLKKVIRKNSIMQCLRLIQDCLVPTGAVIERAKEDRAKDDPTIFNPTKKEKPCWFVGNYTQLFFVRNHQDKIMYFQYYNDPTLYYYSLNGEELEDSWNKKVPHYMDDKKLIENYANLDIVIQIKLQETVEV